MHVEKNIEVVELADVAEFFVGFCVVLDSSLYDN
jgi:hypothetical protein